MLFEIKDTLLFFNLYAFSLLFLVIALARTSNVEYIRWECTFLPYSQPYGKSTQCSTIKCDVSCKFCIDVIFMLRKFSPLPSFLTVFMMNGCWILLNTSSASIDMIMCFIFLYPEQHSLYHINPLIFLWRITPLAPCGPSEIAHHGNHSFPVLTISSRVWAHDQTEPIRVFPEMGVGILGKKSSSSSGIKSCKDHTN